MKILFLSSTPFADCDFPLIKAMQEKGYDITYLIILAPYNLKNTLFDIKEQIAKNDIIPASQYTEIKIYEKYMDLAKVFVANYTSPKDSSLKSCCMALKIIEFIKRGHFDLIHTDCIFSMWKLLFYPIFGHKLLLTVHDPIPHTGEKSWKKSLNYKIATRFSKAFVLLNRLQADEFCNTYKINPNRIFFNTIGIYDNIRMYISEKTEKIKNNILYFGRISQYKGIEYLLQAMIEIRKSIPDATLTIAGSGKFYFDISKYNNCDWLDIQNRYIRMDELAILLQKCTISVCPYIDATQSGVIMTCYSMCVPVIASDVGGLSEMVENGKSGLLVPPKNINALANAITSILNSPQRLDDMKKYIKDEYINGSKSWKSIAEKYYDIYEHFFRVR